MSGSPTQEDVVICDVSGHQLSAADQAALDAIFFAASKTQSFDSAAARQAFHHRWLGRYLANDEDRMLVLRKREGEIVGYVAGNLDDPARTGRFADIAYFDAIADLTGQFPAHLHINLKLDSRGRRLGSRLITAFATMAAERGAPGVHVVTGAQSRNRTFYAANDFAMLREFEFNGGQSVCLGRKL